MARDKALAMLVERIYVAVLQLIHALEDLNPTPTSPEGKLLARLGAIAREYEHECGLVPEALRCRRCCAPLEWEHQDQHEGLCCACAHPGRVHDEHCDEGAEGGADSLQAG